MATYDAGIVTAYGAAVLGGYTGTYEEFCVQQANYAQSAAAVAQAKSDAEEAAQDATESAEALSGSLAQIATNTQDISALKEDISPMQTATTSDVGKALKAKTVEDGKVTAWEFGDTGATTDIHVEGTALVINTNVADGNEVSF